MKKTLIVFYEKPGCMGNAAQKKLLQNSGHELEVKDLLSHPWKRDELRTFFGDFPVEEWFNPFAPDIKSGLIETTGMKEDAALDLMLHHPILIRRPLMEVEGRKFFGFDEEELASVIKINPADKGIESCPSGSGDSCHV